MVIIVVISSSMDEPVFTLDELFQAIQAFAFRIYVIVTFSLMVVLLFVSYKGYLKNVIFVDLLLVALFGGYTVLSTKALSTALSMNIKTMFKHPITYISVAVLVVTAVVSLIACLKVT